MADSSDYNGNGSNSISKQIKHSNDPIINTTTAKNFNYSATKSSYSKSDQKLLHRGDYNANGSSSISAKIKHSDNSIANSSTTKKSNHFQISQNIVVTDQNHNPSNSSNSMNVTTHDNTHSSNSQSFNNIETKQYTNNYNINDKSYTHINSSNVAKSQSKIKQCNSNTIDHQCDFNDSLNKLYKTMEKLINLPIPTSSLPSLPNISVSNSNSHYWNAHKLSVDWGNVPIHVRNAIAGVMQQEYNSGKVLVEAELYVRNTIKELETIIGNIEQIVGARAEHLKKFGIDLETGTCDTNKNTNKQANKTKVNNTEKSIYKLSQLTHKVLEFQKWLTKYFKKLNSIKDSFDSTDTASVLSEINKGDRLHTEWLCKCIVAVSNLYISDFGQEHETHRYHSQHHSITHDVNGPGLYLSKKFWSLGYKDGNYRLSIQNNYSPYVSRDQNGKYVRDIRKQEYQDNKGNSISKSALIHQFHQYSVYMNNKLHIDKNLPCQSYFLK